LGIRLIGLIAYNTTNVYTAEKPTEKETAFQINYNCKKCKKSLYILSFEKRPVM
jgi:hypothetical protein